MEVHMVSPNVNTLGQISTMHEVLIARMGVVRLLRIHMTPCPQCNACTTFHVEARMTARTSMR